MAGHSKWSNIKHRKGAQDALRSKIFAKFSKEIMVAAALGGSDINSNPSLRLAINKAKAKSMPKANIEKAIEKGSGSGALGADYKEIIYSGNLKYGITLLVICLSNNYNRVSSEVQFLFKKANGAIGKAGSIPYNFERKGILEIELEAFNEEEVMMMAIEAGAIDVITEGTSIIIYTEPSMLNNVKDKLEKSGINEFQTAEVTYVSSDKIKIPKEDIEQFVSTLERFEDNEDIQEVFHNVDLSELE
ncbi:MAG: YebC/PmpR family DNA-binding transcriptional regulator [Mycoplasmataceae bacterium]|nr:YebC/PmpR family DNA-binding transcriptional regulator [Mycoplasmataceae bacterium]